MPPSLNIYVYPVRAKRNAHRTGVCVPQNSTKTSSERESAVRSVRPRRAKRTAMNAVAAVGLLKSRGVGC